MRIETEFYIITFNPAGLVTGTIYDKSLGDFIGLEATDIDPLIDALQRIKAEMTRRELAVKEAAALEAWA